MKYVYARVINDGHKYQIAYIDGEQWKIDNPEDLENQTYALVYYHPDDQFVRVVTAQSVHLMANQLAKSNETIKKFLEVTNLAKEGQ
jgi:hypothetical protein